MTPNQKLVQAKVNEILQKAIDLYGKSYPRVKFYLACVPPASFDIRGYRMAGQARKDKQGHLSLRFHPTMVEKYLDEVLNDTVAHEVAHLVCFAEPRLGRRHNEGWKQVCLALGGDGTRCGTFDLGRPSPEQRRERSMSLRPHVYTDSAGVARRVTTQCHNRIQRRGAVYRYRDNRATINRHSPYRYAPHQPTKPVAKPTVTQPTAQVDTGGKSKADICRELIKTHYGSMNEQTLIALIAQRAGLNMGLAKKYFSNNLAKAFTA